MTLSILSISWFLSSYVKPSNMPTQTPEYIRHTDWHKIAVGRPDLVKVCREMVKKGGRVRVLGELRPNSYTNQSGVEVQTYNIVPSDVTLL